MTGTAYHTEKIYCSRDKNSDTGDERLVAGVGRGQEAETPSVHHLVKKCVR